MKLIFKWISITCGALIIYAIVALNRDLGLLIIGIPAFVVGLISFVLYSREKSVSISKTNSFDRITRIVGAIVLLALIIWIGWIYFGGLVQ